MTAPPLDEREIDVLAFGEILVDWVSTTPARSLGAASTFEKVPGGAPANVAVGVSRLGLKAAFSGGIATDEFGAWLRSLLKRERVDTRYVAFIEDANTRMAYVLVDGRGERRLAAFTSVSVADAMVPVDFVAEIPLGRTAAFHFGSVSLASAGSATTTMVAARNAQQAGCLISFDVNLRLPLWESTVHAHREITPLVSVADILKVNEEELVFFAGVKEVERGAEMLWNRFRPSILAVTLGARGAFIRHAVGTVRHVGFPVNARDSTGAGDGFVSGLLYALVSFARKSNQRSLPDAVAHLSRDQVECALETACAVGALATTQIGAMSALPHKIRLDEFLGSHIRKATKSHDGESMA